MTLPAPVSAYAAVSPDGRIDYDTVSGSEETAKIAAAEWYEPEIPLTFRAVTILPTEQYEALVGALTNARQFILDLAHTRWSECEASDEQLVGDIDTALAALKGQDHAR